MNTNSDVPWLNGSYQSQILNEEIKKQNRVPSLVELVAEKQREAQAATQTSSIPQPDASLDNLIKAIGFFANTIKTSVNGSLDKKYLSEGTVFLLCIDRTVKPDSDPKSIPTMLVDSPHCDIKVVSFLEFSNPEALNGILGQYQTLIDQFNSNPANQSHYLIFIGRLVEKVIVNAIDYVI